MRGLEDDIDNHLGGKADMIKPARFGVQTALCASDAAGKSPFLSKLAAVRCALRWVNALKEAYMKKVISAIMISFFVATGIFTMGANDSNSADGKKHYKFGFTCMDQSNPFFVLIEKTIRCGLPPDHGGTTDRKSVV